MTQNGLVAWIPSPAPGYHRIEYIRGRPGAYVAGGSKPAYDPMFGPCTYTPGSSTQWLAFPNAPTYSGMSAFTVTAFVRPTDINVFQVPTIISVQGATNPDCAFTLRIQNTSPKKYGFYINDGTWRGPANSTTSAVNNTFAFVAGVYDASRTAAQQLEIFVNGVSEGYATGNGASANAVTTSRLSIGGWDQTGVSQGFKGYIGDCRLYKRALSAVEIQALYNSAARFEPYDPPHRRYFYAAEAAAAVPIAAFDRYYRNRRT